MLIQQMEIIIIIITTTTTTTTTAQHQNVHGSQKTAVLDIAQILQKLLM